MNWSPVSLDECLDPGEVVKEVDVIEVEDAEGAALILVLPTQRHDWIFKLGCCHLSSVSSCDLYLCWILLLICLFGASKLLQSLRKLTSVSWIRLCTAQ